MNCTLIYCDNEKETIKNPSPEEIETAIDNLIPVIYRFVILKSEEPVQNCIFIQTLIVRNKAPELKYTVEVRFQYEDSFKQLQQYTTDVNELKKMFRMFALGIIPDTADWNDITEELIKQAEEEDEESE